MQSPEIWKPVVGFEGFYEVSDQGRVKSLDRRYEVFDKRSNKTYTVNMKGRILKPNCTKASLYPKCVLTKSDGYKKDCSVHRLVAEAFIPNPENKPAVNHKDHNKSNCSLGNLEWVTAKENTHAARKAGVLGTTSRVSRKFNPKQIEWMNSLVRSGYTDYQVAEMFDTGVGYIRQLCQISKDKLKETRRLKWCYSQPYQIKTI
jgi:hypothetical protein